MSAPPTFTTVTALPIELRAGDRIFDASREWAVISGPWTMACAETVYVFAQHVDQPRRRREFAWSEDDAVTIRREI